MTDAPPRPRIIFFPGLGADARLLEPQRHLHAEIEVPEWLPPLKHESLESYGERFAKRIDPSTPVFLGGVSFGGFVAQEAARHLRPRGLILLSTCRSAAQLPLRNRLLARSAHVTPPFVITAAKFFVAKTRWLFGVTDPVQSRLFNDMLFDADPAFMRWCILATLRWRPAHPPPVPTLNVHGSKDRIIPPPPDPSIQMIKGAGHVVNISHAQDVNRIIERWIAQAG